MRRFKPGQKVVYDPKGGIKDPYMKRPKIGEIVTVKLYCEVYPYSYKIEGYEFSKDGFFQSFHDRHFEPLIETRERITYKLSAPCPPELLNPNQLIELEQINN